MSELDTLFRDFAARVRTEQGLPVVHKAFGSRPLIGTVDLPPPEIVTPALPPVRVQRIEDLLVDAAQAALRRIERKRLASKPWMAEVFEAAVLRCAQTILDAASKKNAQQRAEDMRKALAEERTAKRKALGEELRHGRRRLQDLRAAIKEAESDVARARAIVANDGELYPKPPAPVLHPHKEGEGLPAEPGIYFLWKGDTVEYVGKSIRLSGRVKLGGHHVLRPHHTISYLLIEERLLTWAECYYIGTLQPMANFGASASHTRVRNV